MNILTFDIEEWFHILDNPSTKTENEWTRYESRLERNVDRILFLLEENNLKATFFCLGWVAKKYPEVVKRISGFGCEIGSHSGMHQLVYEQNGQEFSADLDWSIKFLEDLTGKKIRCYRAPGFSVKEDQKWVFEELIAHGIEIDCSIFPAARAHGGFENFGTAEPAKVMFEGGWIKEFPINLFMFFGRRLIFSGGGYFRLLPYYLIKSFMKRSSYVITYFHPRDFDPDQPMISELSKVRKFKSYYGLREAYGKLDKLVRQFDFVDIQQADSMIDWNRVKTITL